MRTAACLRMKAVLLLLLGSFLLPAVTDASPASGAQGGKHPFVLLVHGFTGSASRMKAYRRRLEGEGFLCDDIDLSNRGVKLSIADYAAQLQERVETVLGSNKNMVIIAHSMGGLVARYYLKNLRRTTQVKALIAFGTPHHGTLEAKLVPRGSTCGNEMIPGSRFLAELNTPTELIGGVKAYALWSKYDGVVVPSRSAIWCGAANYEFDEPGLNHQAQLTNEKMYRFILRLLNGEQVPVTGPQTVDHAALVRESRRP